MKNGASACRFRAGHRFRAGSSHISRRAEDWRVGQSVTCCAPASWLGACGRVRGCRSVRRVSFCTALSACRFRAGRRFRAGSSRLRFTPRIRLESVSSRLAVGGSIGGGQCERVRSVSTSTT